MDTNILGEEFIAETNVVLVSDLGEKSHVTLAVGKPYYKEETACCVYYMIGHREPFHAYGEDTFQALCGAIGMLHVHLDSLIQDLGYKIYNDDVDFEAENLEEEYAFPIEAMFCTKLYRR